MTLFHAFLVVLWTNTCLFSAAVEYIGPPDGRVLLQAGIMRGSTQNLRLEQEDSKRFERSKGQTTTWICSEYKTSASCNASHCMWNNGSSACVESLYHCLDGKQQFVDSPEEGHMCAHFKWMTGTEQDLVDACDADAKCTGYYYNYQDSHNQPYYYDYRDFDYQTYRGSWTDRKANGQICFDTSYPKADSKALSHGKSCFKRCSMLTSAAACNIENHCRWRAGLQKCDNSCLRYGAPGGPNPCPVSEGCRWTEGKCLNDLFDMYSMQCSSHVRQTGGDVALRSCVAVSDEADSCSQACANKAPSPDDICGKPGAEYGAVRYQDGVCWCFHDVTIDASTNAEVFPEPPWQNLLITGCSSRTCKAKFQHSGSIFREECNSRSDPACCGFQKSRHGMTCEELASSGWDCTQSCGCEDYTYQGDSCASAVDLSTVASPYAGTNPGVKPKPGQGTHCGIGSTSIFFIDIPQGGKIKFNVLYSQPYFARHSLTWGAASACPGQTLHQCTGGDLTAWTNDQGTQQRAYLTVQGDNFEYNGTFDFSLSWSLDLSAVTTTTTTTTPAACSSFTTHGSCPLRCTWNSGNSACETSTTVPPPTTSTMPSTTPATSPTPTPTPTVSTCPQFYPVCYSDGDCVISSCASGGCSWAEAPSPSSDPSGGYNYVARHPDCSGGYVEACSSFSTSDSCPSPSCAWDSDTSACKVVINTFTVTSNDRPNYAAGRFFNFDKPSGWVSSQVVSVKQCRNGAQVWSGKVRWWDYNNGGSTGNSKGRRQPFEASAANQWQVGDVVTDGESCPQAITPTPTPTPTDIAQIPYSAMTATQSSDYGWQGYGAAALALTAEPLKMWPGTCTSTAIDAEAAPWWKVSLTGVWHVHKVQLTGRDQCCPERLSHVDIYVGTTLCASDVSVGEGSTLTVPCEGIGSEIKVQHQDKITTLTLCGFVAFGEEKTSTTTVPPPTTSTMLSTTPAATATTTTTTTVAINTITVTSNDHHHHAAGQYFNFDKPSGWVSSHVVSVKQCRNGAQVWSGEVIWWDINYGGSTGNSHGRREPLGAAAANQWQVGDVVTDGESCPQTSTTTVPSTMPSTMPAGPITLYITTSGGYYAYEKWVSITTGANGAGTQIWGQGTGDYGNGFGLLADESFQVPSCGTYYVNAYDAYADSWDGTKYEVWTGPAKTGTMIANNGGATPDDSADMDLIPGFELDRKSDELEVSEQFTIACEAVPSLVANGKHCSNHKNLRVEGLWGGGTLQSCGALVAAQGATVGCNSGYFHFANNQQDCGCATDSCTAKTTDSNWDIYYQIATTTTPTTSAIVQIPYSAMTATQSSDYGWQGHGAAALALTAAPQKMWPGTCTSTAIDAEAAPWWKVSLNGVWHVHKVQLTGRDQCCPERLSHVDIYVGTTLCASDVSVGEGSTLTVPCEGIGSEIKVQHKDIITTLTLCGFAAFGAEEVGGSGGSS